MTGTILELNAQRRLGSIRAMDGSLFTFYDSGVVADQYDFLRIGQAVQFEPGRGAQKCSAYRVHSSAARTSVSAITSSDAPIIPQLVYSGFDQPKNIRRYRFSSVARGKPTRHFTVSVDVALFLKHRVAIQDLPALCLRKLSRSDLRASQAQHELTDGDLAAYASDRAALAARNLARRRWHNPRRPAAPVAK